MMSFWKKMQNPYALVGQGFILGGILFFATHPESLLASPGADSRSPSLISTVESGR